MPRLGKFILFALYLIMSVAAMFLVTELALTLAYKITDSTKFRTYAPRGVEKFVDIPDGYLKIALF